MNTQPLMSLAVAVCAVTLAPAACLADNAKSHVPAKAPQPAAPPTVTAVAPKPTGVAEHGIIFVGGTTPTSTSAAINSQPLPPGRVTPAAARALNTQPIPPGKVAPVPVNTRISDGAPLR
jgi:hypothetical protein